MFLELIVNDSMIIIASRVFHNNRISVTSIKEASKNLSPLALVFSGISSSITSSITEKYDLIVLATYEHKTFSDILFESVSYYLKHETTVPLLMIKGFQN